jgi:hypothetical protein
MQKCNACARYSPHEHIGRLSRIPSEKSIFVCEDGDIAFASPSFMKQVLEVMRADKRKDRIWFMQSKKPDCFRQYLGLLPENTYLVTTLETNRDAGYERVSKAPKPSVRYKEFLALGWEKKIVTVEPIMEFDPEIFAEQIRSIRPRAVFIGYNSAPKEVMLPEPPLKKTLKLIGELRSLGMRVYEKDMRDPTIKKNAYRDFNP